jgi:phosphoribosylaminoimidazole carboxylase PurE protein
MPGTEAEFGALEVEAPPQVGIVVGAKGDLELVESAAEELKQRDIRYEIRVMSAHRDPELVCDYAKNAQLRGLKVIIAAAGLSAALPGVVCSHTQLPVIGLPLSHKRSIGNGLDALLAITQMPSGVPIACVGVDSARNAGILAARILGAR